MLRKHGSVCTRTVQGSSSNHRRLKHTATAVDILLSRNAQPTPPPSAPAGLLSTSSLRARRVCKGGGHGSHKGSWLSVGLCCVCVGSACGSTKSGGAERAALCATGWLQPSRDGRPGPDTLAGAGSTPAGAASAGPQPSAGSTAPGTRLAAAQAHPRLDSCFLHAPFKARSACTSCQAW